MDEGERWRKGGQLGGSRLRPSSFPLLGSVCHQLKAYLYGRLSQWCGSAFKSQQDAPVRRRRPGADCLRIGTRNCFYPREIAMSFSMMGAEGKTTRPPSECHDDSGDLDPTLSLRFQPRTSTGLPSRLEPWILGLPEAAGSGTHVVQAPWLNFIGVANGDGPRGVCPPR
jgi:hypothetical protein